MSKVRMKKLAILLLGLMVGISVVGCVINKPAEVQKESEAEPTAQPADTIQLKIGGGPTSGTFYPQAVGVQKLLKEKVQSNYQLTTVVTGGSIENANLIARGEVDIALLTQPNATSLYYGKNEWEGKAVNDLRIITPMVPGHVRFVVRTDSGIKSVKDIKGKRFAVGQIGSGAETFAREALKAHGITYEDFNVEHIDLGGIVDGIKDGKIVGACFAGPDPYSPITDLFTALGDKIQIYSFTPEEIAVINKVLPTYTPWVTKAGTYPKQNSDSTVFAYHYYLVGRESLSEDLAYHLAKGVNENLEWLSSVYDLFKNIDPQVADEIMGISDVPIHNGALKYWREIGVVK